MDISQKKVVWIAGGNGLVGRQLSALADTYAYRVIILSRSRSFASTEKITSVYWDPDKGIIETDSRPDIIINLAGAGIADSRWSVHRKKEILSSRVNSAAVIRNYLVQNGIRPSVYISASAVGYYGDRGEEILTEKSHPGSEFMADTCVRWEEAARQTGLVCERMVILRIGIVLSLLGGALPKLLMTRRMGVFTYFGDGRQYYPWIHIDDLSRLFWHCAEGSEYRGIYNAVAPGPLPQRELMASIMKECRFFGVLLPVPSLVLRIAMGGMVAVILNSVRAVPTRLQEAGFTFQFTHPGEAVRDLLERRK